MLSEAARPKGRAAFLCGRKQVERRRKCRGYDGVTKENKETKVVLK